MKVITNIVKGSLFRMLSFFSDRGSQTAHTLACHLLPY